MGPVIGIAILLALSWVVLVLPARRRQRAHRAMQDEIAEVDEVITAGGILVSLGIIAATFPLLARMTGPEVARNE